MSKKSDITGKKFNYWTAIEKSKTKKHYWKFRCDCGKESEHNKYGITGGSHKSCKECAIKRTYNIEDLTGKKYGKFTVLRENAECDKNSIHLDCQCECGNILTIPRYALIKGYRTRCRKCTGEDLTGKRFGNQVVIEKDHISRKWIVICDCGEKSLKTNGAVKTSNTCGRCESKKYIGRRFGKITVMSILGYIDSVCHFDCLCDCGTRKTIKLSNIVNKKLKSCGCYTDEKNLNSAEKLIGLTIRRFTIKKVHGYEPGTTRIVFEAKCKCGEVFLVTRKQFMSVASCGKCKAPRPFMEGEKHPNAKLTNDEVRSIRQLNVLKIYEKKQICEMYDISESVLSNILLNKTYKNL